MDKDILNEGLNLAMEWGEQWLQPIQNRLHQAHPHLSTAELDEYNTICQAAMKEGHRLAPVCWVEAGQNQAAAFDIFKTRMWQIYPWVSEANLSRLFSQGMYYSLK